MKDVKAKLHQARRVGLSGIGSTGQYDDNVIRLVVKIHEGPDNFLDRKVVVDLPIAELVGMLSPEVAINLRNEITKRLPSEVK